MDGQKPAARIALIDGNSFYCSCERAMRPSLEGKPLIVLSNNDGCAIARTAEAKAMGIKMGDPWFKIRNLANSHGLIALSANFSLYGDLSQRMMNVIGQFSPEQEIYSIDEAFSNLTFTPGTGRELGTSIRDRIRKWVGIPTCVGIGQTKTLAKLANHLAKKVPRLLGVCDLTTIDGSGRLKALRHVAIEDVWGVGRRLAPRLRDLNISTAADLAQADPRVIRDKFSVVLAKTARELNGESCIAWEEAQADKQQIMCSRSFGRPVTEKKDLMQALSVFVTRAAEKLRHQQSYTDTMQIFIRTSFFKKGPQYSGSLVIRLPDATDSTNVLISSIGTGLNTIYRSGFLYAKAGVCLMNIQSVGTAAAQLELFCQDNSKVQQGYSRLMSVIDNLNSRFGRSAVVPASALVDRAPAWSMRQERMTPAYTTDWAQLIELWR